jgi:hypothetical protein
MTAKDRKVVAGNITTSRRIAAYGGTAHSEDFLERLAALARSNQLPFVLQHDPMRSLNAKCLKAEVVDLPDGHKAVHAEYEVDGDAWDTFEAECIAAGAPGGMSFTFSEFFVEIVPSGSSGPAQFSISADAAYFSDDTIRAAADKLATVGAVKAGRLYQFAEAPSCRIIIEFLQSGLPGFAWGLASSALYDCLKYLVARRTAPSKQQVSAPQIEFHVRQNADGSAERVLLLRTDKEQVLRYAVDKLGEVLTNPAQRLEWSEDTGEWREPDETSSGHEQRGGQTMPNGSKAQAVRQYIADHPDAKPQEVADALTAQGVEVGARYVSGGCPESRRTSGGGPLYATSSL